MPQPHIQLIAGPEGLRVRAMTHEVAAEYHLPGSIPDGRLSIPLHALADCAGRDESLVSFHLLHGGKVELRWVHGGVPQMRQYESSISGSEFPNSPRAFHENSPTLLTALDNAVQIAPKGGDRYDLHRVQLRGDGEVVASDGRQLLVHGGFVFPWDDNVLIPRTGIFASSVQGTQAREQVQVGRTESHVWVKLAEWSFALRIHSDGRYPDVKSIIPLACPDATHLHLNAEDTKGLVTVLSDLPGGKEAFHPVTLDLNGHVAIRAKANDQTQTTELRLERSRVEGTPICLVTDRTHLARAARLGFGNMQIVAADKAVVCQETDRIYVWMPLDAEGALRPSSDVLRTSLPDVVPAKQRKNPTRKKRFRVSQDSVGIRECPSESDVLKEAAQVQAALRELLGRMRGLTTLIRQELKQRRVVHATLASLRRLDKLAP